MTVIARDLRLRSPQDFERVRSQGTSWSNRLLVLVVEPSSQPANRYGFAVGRQIRPIVRRNRVKRLLREATRKIHPQIRPGHDLIWIARNSVRDGVHLDDLMAAQLDLLTRAGLLRDSDSGARNSTI